jgi:hypothetical protein
MTQTKAPARPHAVSPKITAAAPYNAVQITEAKTESATPSPAEKATPTKIHLTISEKQNVVGPNGGIVSFFPSQWIQDAGLIGIAVANKIDYRDVSNVTPRAVTFLRDQKFLCGIGSAQVRASQFTKDDWLINAALDGATSFLVNESDAV